MNNATRATVSTFGVIAALAGFEHGVGEIMQGNRVPAGIMIESWPDLAFFEIVSGEPAMTIVPNLLLTGILAISVSLIICVWRSDSCSAALARLILILLSIITAAGGRRLRPAAPGYHRPGSPRWASMRGFRGGARISRTARPACVERGVPVELWGRVVRPGCW
ncbi:MAG: hypothetical protein U0Z44_15985 [Kouleothrix sp.]